MAKLTLSEASRACHVARTTIQRAVKTGRLSLDAEHRVDTAERFRMGYHLDAAGPCINAAGRSTTAQQQGVASQELQLIRA